MLGCLIELVNDSAIGHPSRFDRIKREAQDAVHAERSGEVPIRPDYELLEIALAALSTRLLDPCHL
jgi:hypothetical protein